MNRSRWISILVIICILQLIPFSALGEANSTTANAGNEDEQSGINLNDIEITVSGIPIEDLLGAAAGMFIEALEENMGDAIDGLNDVFSDYAEEMSGDLGEIETILGSLIDDTWFLNIPAVSFDTMIKRSTYDNALDLYRAQLIGEIGREGRIAMNSTENCLNNIIYIYDENGLIPAIADSVEEGSFGEREIIFGLEGYTGTYAVSSVLFLSPSDEPYAMCNMTDLSKEQQFEAYRDYVSAHATKNYDMVLEYGDQIVTIIFWNEEAEADWLTVVAKEVPMLLEYNPVNENAEINSFFYSHSGSSMMEIYSYELEKDESTGEMQVEYDLFCGYQTYTLPADNELVLGLRTLVKNHDLRKWDGFDKSNSLIMDGSGFELYVSFDDGTVINAFGSNSFPEGYGEASEAIDDLFQGYLKKHGIDPEGGY